MIPASAPIGSRAIGGARASVATGGAALAALESNVVVIVQMVYLGFATPISLNLSTWDLTWDGVVYKGAAGLGTISTITDKPGEAQGLTLEMFGDDAVVALALDEADVVQGTPVTIRTAVISADTYRVLAADVEWVGTLDTMAISEDGEQSVVRVSAESKAVDLLRGTPMYYSDSDQRSVNPTDGSFKYVVDQIDKPVVWPARGYFTR
jgi:hypothetical protein